MHEETTKETFSARFCGTPEEYALSALEFVCSEADRLEAENAKLDSENKRLWREIEELGNGTLAKKNYDMCIKCAKVFGEIAVSMDVSLENSTYQLMDILPQKTKEIVAENAELKTRVQQFERKKICVPQNGDSLNTKKEEELEKWRDAFGGRTPEEAKRDFDNIIQDLIDCKAGKRKEAIEIVANHISQMGKMVDVRKLVKPLQWVDTNNKTRSDCRLGNLWICVYAAQWTPDPNLDSWFIGHSDSSEQCIDSLSHIDNDARNLEEAKEAAQDWLVSLVANACGLESEVRNER